jgi:hypothetical protein
MDLTKILGVNPGTCEVKAEIFNLQEKKSAKSKCPLFSKKLQKFHTAEITGYTVLLY